MKIDISHRYEGLIELAKNVYGNRNDIRVMQYDDTIVGKYSLEFNGHGIYQWPDGLSEDLNKIKSVDFYDAIIENLTNTKHGVNYKIRHNVHYDNELADVLNEEYLKKVNTILASPIECCKEILEENLKNGHWKKVQSFQSKYISNIFLMIYCREYQSCPAHWRYFGEFDFRNKCWYRMETPTRYRIEELETK